MPLVTCQEILTPQPQGWAIGAFNVYNMEDIQAVVWAAERLRSPVILQASESAVRYAGASYLANLAKAAAAESSIPIALQLDHGRDYDVILDSMKQGFSSVMVDGSRLPFEENVSLTKQVVKDAKQFGVSVEGELGRVGGKEDDLLADNDTGFLTDPEEAALFVQRTGLDLLAPAIGTIHGLYRGEPKIDFERLVELRKVIDIPLVLHGGSDLSSSIIDRVILLGISKINVGTDLKYAITDGIKEHLKANPAEFEPRKVFGAGRSKAETLVMEKIRLFKSAGRLARQ